MKPHALASALVMTTVTLVTACERRSPPPSSQGSSATIHSAEQPPPTTDTAGGAAQQTPTVQAKMKEHFDSSVSMRRALAFGDLEGFRAAAATLSDKEISANLSEAWKPHLEAMRGAAKRARDATRTASAARALADVGHACAGCHERLGGPTLVAGEPPAPASGARPHMLQHQWAVDRLWDGLIGPSQVSWRKGAEAFTDAPLEPEAIAGQKTVAAHVPELSRRAHAYGAQAHAAGDSTARARSFADVFSTCTACHAELGVKAK